MQLRKKKQKNIYSEKYLEKKLGQKIKRLGGLCIKLLPFQLAGIPDRLCLLPNGIVFFAEIKTAGEKPKKLQIYWQKKLIELCFECYMIDNLTQINEIIESYEKD